MTTPTVISATAAVLDPPTFLTMTPPIQPGDVLYAIILGAPEIMSPQWYLVAEFSLDMDTVSVLRRTVVGVSSPSVATIALSVSDPDAACVVLVVRESSGRTHHVTGTAFTGSEGVTPPGTKQSDDLCLGFVASTAEINDIYVPDDVTVLASAYSDGNFCRLTVFEMESAGQTDVLSKTVRIGTATEGVAGYILIPGAR